jgi:hypothetical protein
MEAEPKPERVTIREAAEIVGVSYERMRQLVRAGLFGCRNGRVERASVLEFARERAADALNDVEARHRKILAELHARATELERIHRLSKRRPTS